MRTRGIWMLLAAFVAALVAVAMALQWMRGQGADRDRIAVATMDIGLGMRLSPQMVRLTEWPRGSVPAGAFAQAEPLDGRVVTVAIQRGEPLTEGRLAPVGARAGLSAVVAPGKRAMTVRVNDVVGVAGFALPGTTVDVMVNTQHEGGRRGDSDRAISKIVLERILVLAVAQEADRDASRPKVVSAVTLEVTPEQAERLDLARSVGTLSLVLRNPIDPQDVATGGATKSALLGAPAPVTVASSAVAERPRTSTRVRRAAAASAPSPAIASVAASAPAPQAQRPALEPALDTDVVHPSLPVIHPSADAQAAPPSSPPVAVALSIPAAIDDLAVTPAPAVKTSRVAEPVTDVAAPPRVCVEILAGASRRNECF